MRVLVEGGRGGKGNAHFKSATHQTPRFAQPGEEGKEEWKILELKVLADVGLVGFPNAGKSTLLAAVTAAKPEIADYPFTTITPNLGVVEYRESRTFIIADIPGIIEGAHSGKGLGLRFLKHIERNATLLFMVPCNADNIQDAYDILLEELKLYNEELYSRISEINLNEVTEITLTISDLEFPIYLGENSEIEKTIYLSKILKHIRQNRLSEYVDYLDLRFTELVYLGFDKNLVASEEKK